MTNFQITDLKIEEMIPNNIDGIHISIDNGHRQIILPVMMSGEQFRKWNKGRGGVFSKDVFLWNKGKEYGNYVLLKGEDKKLILRLIEEENLEDFQARKLVQGKLVDKFYMELKNLSENAETQKNLGYIKENDQEDLTLEDSMTMKSTTNNIPPVDNDEAGSGKSISLFDD
jgi:hypothetical protein